PDADAGEADRPREIEREQSEPRVRREESELRDTPRGEGHAHGSSDTSPRSTRLATNTRRSWLARSAPIANSWASCCAIWAYVRCSSMSCQMRAPTAFDARTRPPSR